jgi:tRNA A-37 threonylcarbamoyl transferase component Bud32
MPIPTDSERIGTTIDGKYRVEALIGKGGMGTVFRAKHTWTGRSVALKVLQPQYAENDAVVLRFLREARAAASFRHPNVVEVLDMGALPEGGAYMALAFLEGESLAAVIERRARLTVEESYASLVPVMRALSLAHGKGIIHRDIKPDNLFMARTDDGAVVPTLLDFGIAKLIDDSGKSTTTGVIFGTPQYMSPEQARGVSDIDGRADVWSVAAVWYECLTGSPPFDAPVPTAVIARILSERATPVLEVRESIPRAIAACIDRGLEPDRSARYASMDDFIDALLEAAAKERVELSSAVLTVRRAEPPERTDAHRSIEAAKTLAASEVPTMTGPTEKPARLQRWTVALGALAFAVVVGFAIVPRGGASTRAVAEQDAGAQAAVLVDASPLALATVNAGVAATEDAAMIAAESAPDAAPQSVAIARTGPPNARSHHASSRADAGTNATATTAAHNSNGNSVPERHGPAVTNTGPQQTIGVTSTY